MWPTRWAKIRREDIPCNYNPLCREGGGKMLTFRWVFFESQIPVID